MERNNPIPVLLVHQSLDGIKQMRGRSYIFVNVEEYKLPDVHYEECAHVLSRKYPLAPASFVYLKEAVFPLGSLKGRVLVSP